MNFGGYEIVRELSRSPVGFEGTARGPDGGAEAFFVQVQYFDPIARRGEERVLVDAFLESVRLQQQVAGGHWSKIHAVGETDQGAFAVSELFPRNAQGIIDGKARLASTDLQRVILGAIDGLMELRERTGGRAHGSLRPGKVLVDDSGGSGRWRVALRGPSPDVWSAEELAQAKLRDARALGGLLVGMVEHRQPRVLPTRIEASEAWERAGGDHWSDWVSAVNRLLDGDLDPSSNWLAEAREAFAAIKVSKQERSKAPLLIAAALGLVVLVGGGYFALPLLNGGGGGQQIVTELTPANWLEWLEACEWVPDLKFDLDQEWPETGSAPDLSPEAQQFLARIRASLPDLDDEAYKSGPLKDAWRPHGLFAKLGVDQLFVEIDGERVGNETFRLRIIAESEKNAIAKADAVAKGVQKVREALGASDARDEIEALRATLTRWGATEDQLSGLTNAIASLDTASIHSTAGVIALVESVDAASGAAEISARLTALDERAAKIAADAGSVNDPLLGALPEAVHRGLVSSLEAAEDPRGSFDAVGEAVERAERVVGRLGEFMSGGYTLVERSEFDALLASNPPRPDAGFAAIEAWQRLAVDPRVVRLTTEEDGLSKLRTAAEVGELLKPARENLARLDELLAAGDQEEIRAALPGLRATLAEVEASIEAAQQIPPTRSHEDELRVATIAFKDKLSAMVDESGRLVSLHSKTLDQVDSLIAGMEGAFPEDQILHEAFLKMRPSLEEGVASARQLPEGEQGRPAKALADRFDAERNRLLAIRDYTGRRLAMPPTPAPPSKPALKPAPLRDAFEARRQSLQAELVALEGAPTGESSEVFEQLAAQIEAASTAAVGLESRLARWASRADIGDVGEVLAPQLSGGPELVAAFAQAVKPLRDRLNALDALPDGSDALLAIAGDGVDADAELRRAAFEQLVALDAGWPATGEALRSVLAAQRSILDAIGRSPDPLWTPAQINAIGSTLWERAMANAATETAFAEVRAMKTDFGLGVEAEVGLSVGVRKNAALLDLRLAFEAVPETGDEAVDEAAVQRAVNGWLTTNRDLFESDAAWLTSLEKAMESEGEGGGDFDPTAYGPGRVRWTGVIDDALEEISYTNGGSSLVFRRVETGDEEQVWFLSKTEVSLGVFLDVVPGAIDGDINRNSFKGPRGWVFDGSNKSASVAQGWFSHRAITNQNLVNDVLFAPALRGSRSTTALESENDPLKDANKRDLPVQQITKNAIDAFCRAIECELPTVEVWLAATRATFEQAGAGSVVIDANTTRALGLQVRDATWRTQFDYYDGLGATGRWDEHDWWFQGAFGWGLGVVEFEAAIDQTWPVDDGLMYFAPVGSGGGQHFSHLVGNVGELVSSGSGVAVIGASAMSPPGADPTTPVSIRPVTEMPAADIGFRVAFKVPAQALNPTVYRKVERVLKEAPLRFPVNGRGFGEPQSAVPRSEPADSVGDTIPASTVAAAIGIYEIRAGDRLTEPDLEIETTAPRFPVNALIGSGPRNPVVEIEFGPDGKVVRADFFTQDGARLDSGSAAVDIPLLDAVHRWQASGAAIDALRGGDSHRVLVRVVLSG